VLSVSCAFIQLERPPGDRPLVDFHAEARLCRQANAPVRARQHRLGQEKSRRRSVQPGGSYGNST
jgi:hypothetical protein